MKKEIHNDFDRISDYFNLELSEKEMLLFEEKVKEDRSFAKKVEIYKKSVEIVHEIDPNSEEKSRKERWRSSLKENRRIKIVLLQRIIGIAASLLVAFTLINYLFFKDSNEQIEKAWNKKVGLDFVFRSTIDSVTFSLSKSLAEYESGNYKATINILKRYDSTSHSYSDILILRALANHQLKNSEKAFKYLDTLNSFRPEVSQWYRGLIYLDNDEIERAKVYLHIPKDSHKEITLKK